MKVCYIAHPYTANSYEEAKTNIKKAEEYGKRIAIERGYAVIVPHNNTALWDYDSRFEKWSYEKWMLFCKSILAKCDVICMCGDWRNSRGCLEEYKFALALNKDIEEA